MGQNQARPEQLKSEAKSKFGKREVHMIKNAYQDLSTRSGRDGISKVAFLRRFPLPGILGERLFEVFDIDSNGAIDWNEFMIGMGYVLRGTEDEKNELVYRMYMARGAGGRGGETKPSDGVTRRDLEMMLHSMAAIRIRSPNSRAVLSADDDRMMTNDQTELLIESAFLSRGEGGGSESKKDASADTKSGGGGAADKDRLSREEFKEWLVRHSEVRACVEGFFLDVTDTSAVASEYAKLRLSVKNKMRSTSRAAKEQTPASPMPSRVAAHQRSKSSLLAMLQSVGKGGAPAQAALSSDNAVTAPPSFALSCRLCSAKVSVAFDPCTGASIDPSLVRFCIACGAGVDAKTRRGRAHTRGTSSGGSFLSQEGYLRKIGSRFRQPVQRWYVVKNGFLHEFHKPKDVDAASTTFLSGCFVEAVSDADKGKPKFGFEIILKEEPRKSKLLYAQGIEERDRWMRAIRVQALADGPWNEYTRKEELGVGRFSSVVCAEHKDTRKQYAMKVIEKLNLDEKEQEALHTEIAVLKIVNHPNILSLESVYETRRQIFIITNLVPGGDLFEKLDAEKVFSEKKTRGLIRKLLRVVDYLHKRGVVHRDLKPENILCTEGADFDLVLGDFGLSKFAGYEQRMQLACGTPAYVAPEVWSMGGYDSKVDLWSIGVMLYLFLSGRFPFSGKDRKELQQQTQHCAINFGSKVWDKVSKEAIGLIKMLLRKNPAKRADCEEALRHPWFSLDLDAGAVKSSKSPSADAVDTEE